MARCFNFGYLTCSTVRIHSFQLFLKDLYKTSTTTCLETNKPLRLYSQKIVQLKCSNELGRPLLWRSERNQGIHPRFSWRKFSTYPGSFIRRKEILILILAGLSGGILYGWSKKLENDKRDREMEELDGLIKIAQEAHKSEKNDDKTVKLYKEALQRVKMLIDSEVQSNQRMSMLTTKFVFILDQVADLLHKLGKLDEAEDYYKQTVQALTSHGTNKDDDAVIEISLKLSSIYAEQERHELAENGFTWCISNARRKMNENKKFDVNSAALLGMCIESYGRYRISQRDANKAISLFTEALEISKKVFGLKHTQVVHLLNSLAVAYNEAGDTQQAKKLFHETIDLAKEVKPGDLWMYHFNFADTLVQSGDLESARLQYEEAMEVCQNENIKTVILDYMSTHPLDK